MDILLCRQAANEQNHILFPVFKPFESVGTGVERQRIVYRSEALSLPVDKASELAEIAFAEQHARLPNADSCNARCVVREVSVPGLRAFSVVCAATSASSAGEPSDGPTEPSRGVL